MGVKIAQQDAFRFKKKEKISSRLELSNSGSLTAYSETCKEEVERTYIKCFISKDNATVPLTPYSFKLGINLENFSNKKQQISDSCEFKGVKCIKCKINILRDEIEPTEEFKKAIDEALDQETDEKKLDEINKLSETFGYFFPLDIEFGGIIRYQIDFNNNISNNTKKNSVELSIQDVCISSNFEGGSLTSKWYTNENYVVIGGDIHECKNINIDNIANQKDWLKSLKDYNKWGLINYSKIIQFMTYLMMN
ncbi:hypothetical protein C2G38_1603369 [Gigaspora rosea]|uniref:MACPF domain-containing protein n=1 Tax=Gigaspora rosea TaxID=44941 RepID=A0A397W9C9_9GLOM|nr:hypothetical protein C2G38_1603369 [Gigaspora rosea]